MTSFVKYYNAVRCMWRYIYKQTLPCIGYTLVAHLIPADLRSSGHCVKFNLLSVFHSTTHNTYDVLNKYTNLSSSYHDTATKQTLDDKILIILTFIYDSIYTICREIERQRDLYTNKCRLCSVCVSKIVKTKQQSMHKDIYQKLNTSKNIWFFTHEPRKILLMPLLKDK